MSIFDFIGFLLFIGIALFLRPPIYLFLIIIIPLQLVLQVLKKIFSKNLYSTVYPDIIPIDPWKHPELSKLFEQKKRIEIHQFLLDHSFAERECSIYSAIPNCVNIVSCYVNETTGVYAILNVENQISASQTPIRSYYHLSFETLLLNKHHIISESACTNLFPLPNNRHSDFYFDKSPKEIYEHHLQKIQEVSALTGHTAMDFDPSILREQFYQLNREDTALLIQYRREKGFLRIKESTHGIFFTLKGSIVVLFNLIRRRALLRPKTYQEHWLLEDYSRHNLRTAVYEILPKNNIKSSSIITTTASKTSNSTVFINAIIILIGLSMLIVTSMDLIYAKNSMTYEKTSGTIVSYEVQDDYDSIDISIEYKYHANGKEYFGHRIYFSDRTTKTDQEVNRLLSLYGEVGKPIQVFYDPKDPTLSILEKGFRIGSLFPIFMAFILIWSGFINIKKLRAVKLSLGSRPTSI